MNSRITLAAASILLLPVLSGAAELPINPGQWQVTMTRTNPMTGAPTTETNVECVKETSFNPSSMMQDAQDCELVKDELNGDTLSFRMECNMEQGMSAVVDGAFQSDGDTGSGNMNMNMNMGEMQMNMKMDWTSRRLGDC